jgi:hypothetical protein
VEFIQAHSGEISNNTEITNIDLDQKTVTDGSGRKYSYRQLLWAANLKHLYQQIQIHPDTDNRIVKAVTETRNRISDLEGNNSILTVYFASKLAPGFFGKIATEHFFYTPNILGQSQAGPMPLGGSWNEIKTWLERFFELTTYEISIPALRDARLSPKGKTGLVISLLFDFKLTRRIREIGFYEEYKKFSEEQITNILDQNIYPGLKDSMIERFSSSPLTMEQQTHNTGGAITGWAFTNTFIPAESKLAKIANSVNTPLPDVVQAGQWTFSPSGFPISLITGKLAADKIKKRLGKK